VRLWSCVGAFKMAPTLFAVALRKPTAGVSVDGYQWSPRRCEEDRKENEQIDTACNLVWQRPAST